MSDLDGYFENLKRDVDLAYGVANEARKKGFDPLNEVESPLALTMAERSVNLIKTIYTNLNVSKISNRILELEDKYGKLDTTVSFLIAREIAEEKFCKFDSKLDAIDCGIRVGFAYMTLGVVASPIEGYTGIRIGKTMKGEDYLVASFSGPIRSAGTTAVCLLLMLIDYLREFFGFAKYDATEDEIMRTVVENRDFHERVANLQYFPTEEEIRFLARNLPIQLDGDPTEFLEVSNFKDLKRVSTNRIRGGFCLAFSEGLAQKAGKAWGRLSSVKENGLKSDGFDWIPDYLILHGKRERKRGKDGATYIKDLVAGRPVYGHPGRSGGFRFRYGRSRTSGFSAVGVHPATMGITGGFLSNGTQLRLEKPSKGCIITSCDTIDGPIVKLKNGSVKKFNKYDEALKAYNNKEIDEIIYLGDLLFSIGDVIDRNADLVKPGFVSEWWEVLRNSVGGDKENSLGGLDLENLGGDFDFSKEEVGLDLAIEISRNFKIPLHPDYIFYWSQISNEEFIGLIKWLNGSIWRGGKLVLDWSYGRREEFALGKRALEILGVRHEVVLDNVVIDEDSKAFLFNLGKVDVYNGEVLEFKVNEGDERGVLDIVNEFCEVEIKDKWGTGIGARMGRPEKAKLRKLTGSPNVLFPLGNSGGRLNSVQEAVQKIFVKTEFPVYVCECGNNCVFEFCEICGKKGKKMKFCRDCVLPKDSLTGLSQYGRVVDKKCKVHGDKVLNSWNRKVDIKRHFDLASKNVGFEDFDAFVVKGVNKLNSELKIPERLEKGILRAKYNLSVNKDGTIRYDATEIPLTHFSPKEIGVDIEKLKDLGYLKDIENQDLEREDQILELMPHDIVLPNCSVLGENRADKVFLNIANFIDEELERFYGLDRFYNLKDKGDLVGVSVVCMAPHNCAGVVGRIIGFSNMQGILASPFMHAAMRRDCDGDEAAVMLLMDVLLNFSRKFLPSHRGASQDAPLVLNARIRAGEVDDQILFFDAGFRYPLNLYNMAEKVEHSSVLREDVLLIGDVLKKGMDGFIGNGFSHNTSDFNLGNNNGIYKTIPTMKEKVEAQMDLACKLRSVDENDVARLILERHFIRDIKGNLRKFIKQEFRCSSCGEKFRRVPLSGVCFKCKGKVIFTVSEGGVRKYMEPAMELIRDYEISGYTKENVELIKDSIERLFGKGESQVTL